MSLKNIPTCHCHIESLDSGSTVEDFAKWELENGTGFITVTDHGSLQAARKVYDIANKKYKGQLTPIIGVEAYFRDSNDRLLKSFGVDNVDGDFKNYWKYGHLTVHFRDEKAFKVGSRLNSLANFVAEQHGSELKPIWGWKELEELASYNVTVASGCLIGMVNRHILDYERFDIAEAYYKRLNNLFGDNFYSEICPHKCVSNWTQEVKIFYADGTEMAFPPRKKLFLTKTNGEKKEAEAKDIADLWHRFKNFKTLDEYIDKRKKVQVEPKEIVDIKLLEGNIQNDCSPTTPDGDVQKRANKFILEMNKKYNKKILIGDDSHFAYPDSKVVQDIRLAQLGTWRFPNSHHRISSDEAFTLFQETLGIDTKTFQQWSDNNLEWASSFKGFKFENKTALPTSFYPQDTLSHVWALIKKHGRMPKNKNYWDRLEQEIKLLHQNGTIDLLPYFFLAEDTCEFFTKNGKLTGPGRGSAAGLLLNYLLEVTHVDPIKADLSLDRFLTLDRIKSGKLPDIDMDFPSRDELVDHENGFLKKKFGDCFTQISTTTTLKLRSAVKDVARWIRTTDNRTGNVPEEIEELTKKFINAPQGVTDAEHVFGYKKDDGEEVEGSIKYDPALKAYTEKYPNEWNYVKKALGIGRGIGRHASGFVVANEPIYNFIPMTKCKGVPVSQYTANSVEAAGGLKMDFLVISSLNDIQRCIKSIQQKYGDKSVDWLSADSYNEKTPTIKSASGKIPLIRAIPFGGNIYDVWNLPEDKEVFRDVCEGRTETVFQFSTPGAQKWLSQFNFSKEKKGLNSVMDMAVFTALDRPGPLDAYIEGDGLKHNMLVEFARRAKGENPIDAIEYLQKQLPETYGIIVFQEQLTKIYQELTKCSGMEAEDFRSDIGKKRMTQVNARYSSFIKKASEKIGKETADKIWHQICTFGQYGFNKSHSVCYAQLGYACAWLKHHFPLEWWSAVLSHASKNEVEEKFWPHIGHMILPPDINKSTDCFISEGNKLRSPISLIQGIGEKAHNELVINRPYISIEDFYRKIKKTKETNKRSAINKSIVEKLVCSGVMDSLFNTEMDISDKMFECNKVQAMVEGKKKIEQVSKAIVNLNPLQRYQFKKDMLSMYGEDLRELASNYPESKVAKERDGQFSYQINEDSILPVEDLYKIQKIMNIAILPPQGLQFATIAYIASSETFAYQKKKEAVKILVDIQGMRWEMVKWPTWGEDKLPTKFKQDLTGSICLVHCKKQSDKAASIVDIKILQKPLNLKEESEDE